MLALPNATAIALPLDLPLDLSLVALKKNKQKLRVTLFFLCHVKMLICPPPAFFVDSLALGVISP